MLLVADLHIHSRFSRATSRDLSLPELHVWAQRKGISVIGTGDITHPAWLEEIADQLVPAEEGLLRLRPDLAREADEGLPAACRAEVRFVLQGEISSIYKHEGAVRKVHNVAFCPDLAAARRFAGELGRLGNVTSDGRPILGLSSRDLLEVLLESGKDVHLIPAHVWTPWFSLLGSKSGYDSVEACFGDLAREIFALETGLSSDPPMNWRLSSLDSYALVSNSDAHSARNLGREANEFDVEPSYRAIFESLRRPGDPRFLGTIEFFPEEGKYHLDGHRKCGVRLSPRETLRAGGRCPKCGGKITVGVLHRVEDLADRPEGVRPRLARPFTRLVGLANVVGECLGVGSGSQRVRRLCEKLYAGVGPELAVLREAPLEDVTRVAGSLVAEGIRRVREGRLHIAAGYDGEFGTVQIFRAEERADLGRQGVLFQVPDPVRETKGAGKIAGRNREPTARPKDEGAVAPWAPTAGENLLERRPTCAAMPATRPQSRGNAEAALEGLNPEQAQAVLAPAGPLAIVAGPGTGKTRTLTRRIAHRILSGGVAPERVLAVTFTNRAAEEMRERLTGLLGPAAARMEILTLHAVGLKLLRAETRAAGLPPAFIVLGEEEAAELLRTAIGLPSKEARAALAATSLAKREGGAGQEWAHVQEAYRQALAGAGAVDLDDLIAGPVRLLESDEEMRGRWQGRFAHVAVDEFQDLDRLQYRFLGLLAPGPADMTVIGDPDQSIYGFRGADPGLFERFMKERSAARMVKLLRNYRSTATILEASSQVLNASEAEGRAPLIPFVEEGPRLRLVASASDAAEAELVVREVERLVGGISHLSVHSSRVENGGEEEQYTFGDMAVLCRLRAQQPILEEAFARSGIPYRLVGGETLLLRGKGKSILSGLRERPPHEPAREALGYALGAVGLPPDDPTAAGWLAAAAGATSTAELLERVVLRAPADDFDPRAEAVVLMTLHAAKGLEFPVVFLTGCEEGLVPYLREGEAESKDSVAEERRLLYVGVTRARQLLYITRARRRLIHGKRRHQKPSRFLADIERALVEAREVRERRGTPSGEKDRQLRLL